MNRSLFFLVTAWVHAPHGCGAEDERLLQLAKEGFEARSHAGGLASKEEAVPAFQKVFAGINDSQKIKALAFYLYDIDRSESKWSMSATTVMGPIYALSDDPDFINDWSALREMLGQERDPRKFYLLSRLVPLTMDEPNYDFIAERTHMLFADGRVAKEEGEYTKDYAHDVSVYAYNAIMGNLRILGADFEPPPKDLPHEEKAVILAKWLKANWPGCEGIEIPERQSSIRSQQGMSLVERAITRHPRRVPEGPSGQDGTNDSGIHYRWIVSGVLFVGILVLVFKLTCRRIRKPDVD
jgi:hypothetical protein